MSRAAITLALGCSLAGAGCLKLVDPCAGISGTCLAVQVDAAASVGRVDSFSVQVAGGTLDLHATASGGEQPLPIAFAITFGALPTSPLAATLDVTALRGGVALASGSVHSTIVTGQHQTVHVTLGSLTTTTMHDLSSEEPGDLLSPADSAPPPADLYSSDLAGCTRHLTANRLAPDVLLLQTAEGSMFNDMADGSSTPSRWTVATNAVNQVVTATEASVNWGLMLFPLAAACGAPTSPNVDVGNNSAASIATALSTTSPNGPDAATAAVTNGRAYLDALGDGRAHYLVLVTSSTPNCGVGGDDTPLAQAQIGDALAMETPTFVISCGSIIGTASDLPELASAGGEGAYVQANSQDDYVNELQAIAKQVTACNFGLPSKPMTSDSVTISAGGTPIAYDSTRQNGWAYGGAQSGIQLFGAACTAAQTANTTALDVVYQCN